MGAQVIEKVLEIARKRLEGYERQVTLVHGDFSRIDELLSGLDLGPVNGVLADLGVDALDDTGVYVLALRLGWS